MSNDDVHLPVITRQISIFDDHNDRQEENEKLNFPIENTEMYYPIEYIEKVTSEIELWKMHITKTLEENRKLKAMVRELKNTVVDENILSMEQSDIIATFNFEEYMRRIKIFCDKAEIIAHMMQHKGDDKFETRYLMTRRNLEKLKIIKQQ